MIPVEVWDRTGTQKEENSDLFIPKPEVLEISPFSFILLRGGGDHILVPKDFWLCTWAGLSGCLAAGSTGRAVLAASAWFSAWWVDALGAEISLVIVVASDDSRAPRKTWSPVSGRQEARVNAAGGLLPQQVLGGGISPGGIPPICG
jgi:hypothetical protein